MLFLSLILIFFFFNFFFLLIIPADKPIFLRNVGFFFSLIYFFLVFFFWYVFDFSSNKLQWFMHLPWNSYFNIYFSGGLDGVSILFVLLTSFLIPLCILYSWIQFKYHIKEILLILFFLEFFLFNFFFVSDLFFFFVFFEVILSPMFILIGKFGSRQRKIHASFQFFIYTVLGSFFLLIAILFIYLHEGSTDFVVFYYANFNYNYQLGLWICFFVSLAVKVPIFPVHIWLPEAHVEAPTIGSVILAGVLLKMGTYGMLRFLIPVLGFANFYFNPFVFLFCFFSIYYISIVTFCQIDLKKLIAYSSVAHMGYVTMGLFTFNLQGLQGSVFLMISHGVVSSLLFFLVGMLYDRYKTRIVFFYKSIHNVMPLFSFFFFIATLANIGFPGTISFIGEFLLLFSFLLSQKLVFFFNSLGFLISIAYAFWLYNKISFLQPFHLYIYSDFSKREFFVVFPLIVLVFFFGIFPNSILVTSEYSVVSILQLSTYSLYL